MIFNVTYPHKLLKYIYFMHGLLYEYYNHNNKMFVLHVKCLQSLFFGCALPVGRTTWSDMCDHQWARFVPVLMGSTCIITHTNL